MSRKVSLIMMVVGAVIAGFGFSSHSLVVVVPLVIIGYGLMAVAVLFRKTEK